MHHAFKVYQAEHEVELSRGREGYRLQVGVRVLTVALRDGCVVVDGVAVPVQIATRGDDVFVHLEGESYQLHYEHPLERLAQQAQGAAEDSLRAPMPGSLVVIHARPGQKVTKGEALLVMESMKMETTLAAPRDGVVADVQYAPGQSFDRDAVLLTLEPVT